MSRRSAIRSSRVENGQQVNYPFDLDKSRALYKTLFGAVEDLLPQTRHLVFEPDGAMLQLPPTVLVSGDKGIEAYKARMESPDGDPFDFTGVEWLGRGREVSIAVSPRGFLDIRKLAASTAPRNYLGLGHNAKPAARPVTAVADECDWPLATWQNPISADELYYAQKKLGAGGSAVKTDAAFSDSALLAESDLDQYRVLHFATHGLVTAPRADCPARPALVTSFGDMGSDGLLSFREIFDLKLNADLVILSACDNGRYGDCGGKPGGRRDLGRELRPRWPRPCVRGGWCAFGHCQPLAGARRLRRDQAPHRRRHRSETGTGSCRCPVGRTDPADGRPQHIASVLLGSVHNPRRRGEAAGVGEGCDVRS